MMTKEEIAAAVEADVVAGLEKFLRKVEFETTGPFAAQQALVDGSFAAVQWRFIGVDCEDGFSMWNTGAAVEVAGLTVVDFSGETPLFHRHIDWNSVNAQLGGSRGRSAVPVEKAKDPSAAKAAARDNYQAEVDCRMPAC